MLFIIMIVKKHKRVKKNKRHFKNPKLVSYGQKTQAGTKRLLLNEIIYLFSETWHKKDLLGRFQRVEDICF